LAAVLQKKTERIPYEVVEEEKIPGSRVRFKLKLSEEATASRLDEVVNEFTKQVRLDGFRPGKAPKHLVRNRFEPAAREEMVKRIVNRVVELYAEDKGYEVIGQPYLLDYKSNRNEGTSLELAIEVHPEISVSDEMLSGLTAEVHRVAIDEAYINNSLEKLREQNATFEATEEGYAPKDGMLFNCVVTDTQGRKVDDRSVEKYYSTRLEEEMPKAVAEALVGKKKGEKVALDVTEEVEGAPEGTMETVHYEVEVLEVKRRSLPTLDDEFAKDVSDKFESLADLRKATEEGAAKQEEARQREEALNAVYAALRSRLDFDLPRQMVDNTASRSVSEMEQRLNQYGLSLRNMDKEVVRNYTASMQEQAKTNVKNYLILRAVAKHLNVTPTEEQINAALADLAKGSNRKPLAIRAQLEAKKQWEQFVEDLTLKLTNDELLKRVQITHKDTTVDDLAELQRKAQEEQAAKLRGEG